MNPLRSRSMAVVALVVGVLPVGLLAVPGTSYAVNLPHARDDVVAHTSAVPAATELPTEGLRVGDAPRIPYAFASKATFEEGDWKLLRPDGTSMRLPRLTWSAWAPMGDGAIGMAGTEAGPELQRVSGTGSVRTRMVQHFGIEVSPDDEIVGWLGDHGHPQVVEGDGTRHFAMPRVANGTRIAAIDGEQTCQEQEPEGGGCSVFVARGRHVWVSTSHGIVARVGPMRRVADVNRRGRVIGLGRPSSTHPDGCWGVFRSNGRRVFRTCHSFLDSFSPDGHRVLAERAQTRWWSIRRFAVLGRDGHVVHAWRFRAGPHRALNQLTWEDPHHLLGILMAHHTWGLVRIGTDGTVEYAAPPVAQTDEFSPYNLPVR